MADSLTSPEIEAKIAADVAKFKAEDAVAAQAAATPLPGPLRDAFAIQPDIQVGKWSVRPFYDVDVEILQALDHPLHQMMLAGKSGKKADVEFLPRGPHAWQFCWLLTNTPDDAEQAIKDGTLADKAKKEFGKLQMGGIVKLCEVALKQMEGYWSTAVGYGAPSKEGDGANPQGSQ